MAHAVEHEHYLGVRPNTAALMQRVEACFNIDVIDAIAENMQINVGCRGVSSKIVGILRSHPRPNHVHDVCRLHFCGGLPKAADSMCSYRR
jgi:hypothetical protein